MPPDKLNHDQLAAIILRTAKSARPPCAIALHGSWGRGKSDVLNRLADITQKQNKIHVVEANPWSSGDQDVLSCIARGIARYCIDSLEPNELAGGMLKVSKLGLTLCDRLLARPILTSAGIDVETTMQALTEACTDHVTKKATAKTPLEQALDTIKDFCIKSFQGERVVIIIDEIDRCPPSWRHALLESIYFLKQLDYPAVFVCAIEQDTLLDSHSTQIQKTTEICSLSAKVFDSIYTLPDTTAISHWVIEAIESIDTITGLSIREYFSSWKTDQNTEKVSTQGLANGICAAVEFRTPRCALRSISRLRSMALNGISDKYFDIYNHDSMFALGATLGVKERFPYLLHFLSNDLAKFAKNLNSHNERLSLEHKNALLNLIQQSHDKFHSSVIKQIFESNGVFLDDSSGVDRRILTNMAKSFAESKHICNRAWI